MRVFRTGICTRLRIPDLRAFHKFKGFHLLVRHVAAADWTYLGAPPPTALCVPPDAGATA